MPPESPPKATAPPATNDTPPAEAPQCSPPPGDVDCNHMPLPTGPPPLPPLPPTAPPAEASWGSPQREFNEGSRSRSSTPASVTTNTVTVNNTTNITVYNNYNMTQAGSPDRRRNEESGTAVAQPTTEMIPHPSDPAARYRVRGFMRRPSAGHSSGPTGEVEDLDDSLTTMLPPKEAPQLGEAPQKGEVPDTTTRASQQVLPTGLIPKPKRRTNIIPTAAPPNWQAGGAAKKAVGPNGGQVREGVECLLSSFGIASLRSASPVPDCSVPGTVVFEQRKQEKAADWG